MKKYIAYYRVSTSTQGKSMLGLHVQKNFIADYIKDNGKLIAEFSEIKTGTKKKERVEIYKAIKLAKEKDATIVVSKLDRLSRDTKFITSLFNDNIKFVCCDNPNADKSTIQALSVIAEREADQLGKHIHECLKIKKDQIKKGNYINKDGSIMKPIDGTIRLGNPNGFGDYQTLGIKKIKENARNNKENLQAMDVIGGDRISGMSYQAIAEKLNSLQYTTRYGKEFSAVQVQRLYLRSLEK